MKILKDKKIINILSCPHCKADMFVREEGSGVIACKGAKTHCFDLSGVGHANFSRPSQSGGGDSAVAVKARSAFLDKGFYEPIANAVGELVSKYLNDGGVVVDAGCGEGYYSMRIAERGISTFGIDISKPAVEAASKRAKRVNCDNAFFGVASVYEMPLRDDSVSIVTNIFAPCVESEYKRVLKKRRRTCRRVRR
jgi:23S rRNA (guanine745-N1)-methyltransferase